MNSLQRAVSKAGVTAGLLSLSLAGCGGGSDPITGPTVSTPTTTTLTQGTFSLGSVADANAVGLPLDAARQEFNVSGSGRLDITVNWTFGTNPVGFGIYQGSCTFSQWYNDACIVVANQALTFTKPARMSVNASAGTHTIVIANGGSSSESGTFQVTLTR